MVNNKRRFLLKISGELLKGDRESGLCFKSVDKFILRLKPIIDSGVQLGIVVGGGNIFRGASGDIDGYDRRLGDQIGMMSTVLNGLAILERFKSKNINAYLSSGINIDGVADLFNLDRVEDAFIKSGVVIFCGGIGNPYLSTDTTAAMRALQIRADAVFKATKVDGIYDSDPVKNSQAKLFNEITFDEIIQKKLKVMDLSAMILMRDNKLKLMVFNMSNSSTLERACQGENVGTVVKE